MVESLRDTGPATYGAFPDVSERREVYGSDAAV